MNSSQIIIISVFGAVVLLLAQRFPRFALTRPVTLLVTVGAIIVTGIAGFFVMPVELMPNNSFGIITITTPVRGGMSPSEIERQITKPIEEAVAAVSNMRNMISNSTNGKSVVSIEFEPGTNMDFATLDVREKFSAIKGSLPRDIETPVIAHYREADVPIHIVAFTSSHKSAEELRSMVERTLKEKLMRVKGVANVDVAGGRERKIIIDVDKHRLFAHHMDIRQLVGRIEESNLNLKAGELQSEAFEASLRTTGQFQSVDEIANTVIGLNPQGTALYVKDVAVVRDNFMEQESLARLNQSAAVTLYIQKDATSNTVQVVKGTSQVLESFKSSLPSDIEMMEISNQGDAIMGAVGSVRESLLIGVLLIFLVLGFFLGRRSALVVSVSIPLATLMAGTVMFMQGLTINVMTLSGLALGIGLLVDNSIVVLDSILRRQSTKTDEIIDAIQEQIPSIIGGTLTSIVVFVPFILLSKQLQLLYSGMAFTIIAALLASLFVALTTVPALTQQFVLNIHNKTQDINPSLQSTSFFLRCEAAMRTGINKTVVFVGALMAKVRAPLQKWKSLKRDGSEHQLKKVRWRHSIEKVVSFFGTLEIKGSALSDRLMSFLEQLYARSLPLALQNKTRVLAISAFLFLGALFLFQFHIEKDFSSGEEMNEFIVFVELPSGKRLEISDDIVKEVEKKIKAHKPVESSIHTLSTRIEGWSSKVYVTLNPSNKRPLSAQQVIHELRPVLADVGKEHEAFVYFSSPKTGQELTINVYGENEETTANYAMQVAGLFENAPGFVDTKIRYRPGRPEINVIVNPQRTALFGLNPTEVGQVVHAQTRGLRATYFRDQGEEIETIVRLGVAERDSIDAIKALLIETPSGAQVSLAQIADFDYTLAPSEIWRNNKQRMIQVSSNIEGKSLEKAALIAKSLLTQIPFNTDYSAEISGDYHDRVQAQRDFSIALILTCLLIFGVLACLFESLFQPILLFVSVPVALIGIVSALLLTRSNISMGTMIGMLMTGGIVVNNAILLLEHYKQHKTSDVVSSLIQTGQNRLRPILMTTLTTVLGLVPMALDHRQGAELWRPMAIATIGGLLSSMLLTLIVLPVLIAWIENIKNGRLLSHSRSEKSFQEALADSPLKTLGNSYLPEQTHQKERSGVYVHRATFLLAILLCLSCLTTFKESLSAESLPPWVSTVVNRRINDLLSEAVRYENEKDYSNAIDTSLEAVRLDPQSFEARQILLRVNQKALAVLQDQQRQRRKEYVRLATDKHRGDTAWRQAMEGKMSEATRLLDRGQWSAACDRFYQILDQAPQYIPAIKGLEQAQAQLTRALQKGGRFGSDDARQVAQGFWHYNNREWQLAFDAWSPIINDPSPQNPWGALHIGDYAARALAKHEAQVRQAKIDLALDQALKSFRNGDLGESEEFFKSVLELDPGNAQAREYIKMIPGLKQKVRADVMTEVHDQQIAQTLSDAVEFYLKGYFDEADAKVGIILKENPVHAEALALRSDIQKARGLPPIPTLEEKQTLASLERDKTFSDGIIAFAEGRYDEAKKLWEQILKDDPHYTRAAQALKKLKEDSGEIQ